MIKAHADGSDVRVEMITKGDHTATDDMAKIIRGVYKGLEQHSRDSADKFLMNMALLLTIGTDLITRDDSMEADDKELIQTRVLNRPDEME